MTTDEDSSLLRIAGAISDREAVDWATEGAADAEVSALERELRALEGVTTVLRGARPGRIESGPPPERWGRLIVLQRLGEGAFGEVFLARDPVLERDVALKLIRPGRSDEASQNLYLAEARLLARIRHPHVLTVYGADRHEGRMGLWTERLVGRTLERLLEEQGRFGAYEAAIVGLQLCRALAAVHAAGLVHRDVKTTNVMREEGGRIVLMDFGAVRELAGTELELGEGGLGTPIVMAPEQLRGEAFGPAADLYGLGVLLYRLVSGRYPFAATSVQELADLHALGPGMPLRDARPDLPPEFVRVVERALNLRPEARFGSAGDMERALAMATGTLTRTELGLPAFRKPRPRVPWALVIVSVTLALIAALFLAVRLARP